MARKPKGGREAAEMATAAPARRHSLTWLQGLACGGVVTLAAPSALLLAVLLGPTLLALSLDRQTGRPTARGVALCNMAASVGPLRTLWASGHSMAMAASLAMNVQVLGQAWSAAAAGWLLAEAAPIAVRAVLEALSVSQAARLRAARSRLVEEWGLGLEDGDQ